MPINCPIPYLDACAGCRNLFDNKCGYYFPPRPLTEILTYRERLGLLEKKPAREVWQPRQWDRMQQIEAEQGHIHNDLHFIESVLGVEEYIDESGKPKKRATKKKGGQPF